MNARFSDQFRTAIEVREIGNPSENDVVRLPYIRAIYHERSLRFSFCVLPSRTGENTGEKRENRANAGTRRGKETTRMPGQYRGLSIVTGIFDSSHNSFFSSRRYHPHPATLPIPPSILSLSVSFFFPVTGFEDTLPPVFGVLIDRAFRERHTDAFVWPRWGTDRG